MESLRELREEKLGKSCRCLRREIHTHVGVSHYKEGVVSMRGRADPFIIYSTRTTLSVNGCVCVLYGGGAE